MNSFFTNLPSIRISKSAKTFAGGAFLAVLTACASSSVRTVDSSLPIEIHHAEGGQITGCRVFETSGRMYLAGGARKARPSEKAHVEVQLIGPSGEVLAEGRDAIGSVHPAHGGGKRFTDSFVVSFPPGAARQAVKIRVIYRGNTRVLS